MTAGAIGDRAALATPARGAGSMRVLVEVYTPARVVACMQARAGAYTLDREAECMPALEEVSMPAPGAAYMRGLVEESTLGLPQMTDTKGHGDLVLQERKAANGHAKTVLSEEITGLAIPRAP